MTDHAWLKKRGYLNPDCRCGVENVGPIAEVIWNPLCRIHKDDVIGENYEPPNK